VTPIFADSILVMQSFFSETIHFLRHLGRYMQEQLDNWGKMAAFMHMTGRVPAAYADQPGKASIARYRRRKVAVYSGI
jgi:hypothetical protein